MANDSNDSKNSKNIFILCGNDGTGKSTLVKMINALNINCIALERNSPECKDLGLEPSIIDNMTLVYSYEPEYQKELVDTVVIDNIKYSVFWLILDADISILTKRLSSRPFRDKWESHKSLTYFRNRFREVAANYGLPMINVDKPLDQIVNEILEIPKYYSQVRKSALMNMTYDNVVSLDIETQLARTQVLTQELLNSIIQDAGIYGTHHFLFSKERLVLNMLARYHVRNHDITHVHNDSTNIVLHLVAEGESKKVYKILTDNPYLQDRVIIVLKATIYSHSMQTTGQIKGLSEIRAQGSQIFLEMMYRNGLSHAYHAINKYGIIMSDYIQNIPPTEIVVKKYCEGTDKHAYHNMLLNSQIVLSNGEYVSGPYVRFDWRNPNHLQNSKSLTDNPYYYVVESELGKEEFFDIFIRDVASVQPFGDKSVSEELVSNIIDTNVAKENVLKLFYTIQHYLTQVGLEIKDVCFMLDSNSNKFWSEINQDCMRIKLVNHVELSGFDKDTWRTGGSGSKELILKKWIEFNTIMKNYFRDHRFHNTEILEPDSYVYQKEICKITSNSQYKVLPAYKNIYDRLLRHENTNISRRVIVTLDLYDEKPVLVQKGKVMEVHSDGDVYKAFEKISIFPDILVVDLNGAIDNKRVNRDIIKDLATRYYVHVGGGLRSLEDVQDILESSARRIVVSSNTDDEFIKAIPKDRLIVELSVDQDNHILTHGRSVNTREHVKDKILALALIGVEAISMTFHVTEGLLQGVPRDQIREIMMSIPQQIQKVIFAGGISTVDDLEFLWSFPKVIPQLGSALWKNKLSVGQVYSSMVNRSAEIVPAIIQDTHGRVKGLVYMNSESIMKTCDTRTLHRFSRQFNQVLNKGETSGNYQKVIKMSLDCDSDALLITVDTEHPFCHTGNYSCFSQQTVIKASLSVLNDHIKKAQHSNSYSGLMQKHVGLALCKVMEEFWEVVTASKETNSVKVHECSDLLVHLLMAMNGLNVSLEDIFNELNARRWNPKLLQEMSVKIPNQNKIVLAVTAAKYSGKTDLFMEQELGIKIFRPQDRQMKISYEIIDQKKYDVYFPNKKLVLVPSRPKDMAWLIAFKRVDGAITYNTVLENFPKVYQVLKEVPDSDLRLCLIKRKGDIFNQLEYNSSNKMLIACEHVNHVYEYLHNNGYAADSFSLDRVIGSSEGYMVNTPKNDYILCDAIVESGKTLEANGLEIWQPVLNYGEVKIGLYMDIRL